jgi:hypothetical protein
MGMAVAGDQGLMYAKCSTVELHPQTPVSDSEESYGKKHNIDY